MSDDLPSGDKAVYVFIEMIALGFVLYAIEEVFKDNPSWRKVGVALVCGLIFFLVGIKWPKLKSRLAAGWSKRIDAIIHDYRYRYGLFILLAGIAAAYVMLSMQSIRRDLNAYIIPRRINPEQAERLRQYLSQHDASAVAIKVVRHDREALEYADQLMRAMQQTNWDVNPPNHDGPASITLMPYQRKPSPNDVGADGKRVYKNYDDYLAAHDEWVEAEIRRGIDENMYDVTGLCIEVDMAGQPVNPDPRHPTPDAILGQAMRYAGIEVDCGGNAADRGAYRIYLLVGHRPHTLSSGEPFKYKIEHWIERLL